jgi:hypothetical protein
MQPNSPIEVGELTDALGSWSRQYQQFALNEGLAERSKDARLLIASVTPGSIIINFVPDSQTAIAMVAPMIPDAYHQGQLILKFAKRIKRVLDFFLEETHGVDSPYISIKDCNDAANIVQPIAQHGGMQSFTTIVGDVHNTIIHITANDAAKILEKSEEKKAQLLLVDGTKAQRVALVWDQLARDAAKVDEKRSPDKGIIAEIDTKSHPVFFTDVTMHLKKEMIDDHDNPYQKVFFVDVDISRVPSGGIGNYRVTAYHGSDDLPAAPTSLV